MVILTEFQIIKQYSVELKTEGFDFTKGFKCSDIHKFEKLNDLTFNRFELNFCQDKHEWKRNLLPIEISKNDSDRVIDLLIYENHYALIKKPNVFLGDLHRTFICSRCLNSYTSEHMLKLHKPKCENINITTIVISSESHFHWKNNFHKNPSYFRIYADFEADNEIDKSSTGNQTTKIFLKKSAT